MTLNWLDYCLLFLLAAFIVEGAIQGFSRLIIGLVATITGLLFAAWGYGLAGAFLLPFVSSKSVANVIGFLLVFIGVQVLGALLAFAVARLFKWTGLSWLDRLLGATAGAVKGAVIGIGIVMILTAFPLKQLPEGVAKSSLAPYAILGADVLAQAAPMEFRYGFQQTYERLKKFWTDYSPASRRNAPDTVSF